MQHALLKNQETMGALGFSSNIQYGIGKPKDSLIT